MILYVIRSFVEFCVIFRKLIVRVIDITYEGVIYINYECISFLMICIMGQSETRISFCTCQCPKFIASSATVLITSFYQERHIHVFCSPPPNVSDKANLLVSK